MEFIECNYISDIVRYLLSIFHFHLFTHSCGRRFSLGAVVYVIVSIIQDLFSKINDPASSAYQQYFISFFFSIPFLYSIFFHFPFLSLTNQNIKIMGTLRIEYHILPLQYTCTNPPLPTWHSPVKTYPKVDYQRHVYYLSFRLWQLM